MRRDQRGIEGLPLRLMLVALLISLALPTMISVMHETTSNVAEQKAAEMAEEIAATLEEMSSGGPGNVRTVKVPDDLPAGIAFSIGGENGSVDYSRIKWDAGGREGSRYLTGVIAITEDGKPMVISAGDSIRLECPLGTWGTVKVVKV
ncbi:MAG TPA: cupin domain-containing protein [Methanomassiliicoccales archaeon]|nr:cupin domain-containing protein [Methanomassiliicoccales archaeon]